jgi:hypothetical protein
VVYRIYGGICSRYLTNEQITMFLTYNFNQRKNQICNDLYNMYYNFNFFIRIFKCIQNKYVICNIIHMLLIIKFVFPLHL